MTASRPFRYLCPEADERDAMTDEEFWARVLTCLGSDMRPGPDGYLDDGPPDNGIAVISDHVSPCPICHEWGACGVDAEGRPMIHALYDQED